MTGKYGFRMNRAPKSFIFAVVLLLCFCSAADAEIRAFHNINQSPFKQIFGLPSLDNNPLTETHKLRMSLIANISNTNEISFGADEQIENDSETFRGSLIASYVLLDNWQMSVEVPYIRHDGGFLDNFIYDWHDFFNLSQNGRTKDKSNQLHIAYMSNSNSLFAMHDAGAGLGDIRLNSAYSLPWGTRTFIFSTEVKFPTGDFYKLTGSGGYDFSVGLLLNDPQSLGEYGITVFGGVAGVFLGDIDGELSAVQNDFAIVGRLGIGWQVTKLIQLKMQLDGLTALYDSELKQLGDESFQVIMGGSLCFTDNVYLDISVAENINSATGVDVAFQLGLVVTFL